MRVAGRARRACISAVALAMGLVAWAATDSAGMQHSAQSERTVLVSRASGPHGANANNQSGSPSISGDGRFVAFESEARNLHPDARDYGYNIFVRDLETHKTVLVSRFAGSAGASGGGRSPSISADGRYVAYDGAVAPGVVGVAVRDLVAKTTVLASHEGGSPSISADGRYVAFTSNAANLHPDDSDYGYDIYVRDLVGDTTELVSRASGEQGADANGWSVAPSVSADGRFVAFQSEATNLDPGDTHPGNDVFVRDLETETTTLVRRTPGRDSAQFESGPPSISADGRFVAFESGRRSSVPQGESYPGPVLVRDLKTHTTTLVSRSAGRRGAVGTGESPSISADGRLVAFRSGDELHPYDYNGHADIYVRDLKAHTTILASRASGKAGARGNGYSLTSSISANGRFVAFDSYASDLHPDDRGGRLNISIFARGIGRPPLPRPPRKFCDGRRATTVILPTGGELPGGGDAFLYRQDRYVISGSRDADTIEADNARYRICGRGGGDEISSDEKRDRIFGGAGADYVESDDGRDYLVGGIGDDGLRGGHHNDLLVGGPGNDVLDAGAGRDRIRGGRGDDFIPTAGVFRDRVDCGHGDDRAVVDRHDRVRRCEHVRVRESRARL